MILTRVRYALGSLRLYGSPLVEHVSTRTGEEVAILRTLTGSIHLYRDEIVRMRCSEPPARARLVNTTARVEHLGLDANAAWFLLVQGAEFGWDLELRVPTDSPSVALAGAQRFAEQIASTSRRASRYSP